MPISLWTKVWKHPLTKINIRLKFSTPRLRRHVHKHYSHAAHSRKRKLESLPAPPEIKIYDFIQKLNKSEVQTSSSGQNQQPSAPKKRVPPIERLKVCSSAMDSWYYI